MQETIESVDKEIQLKDKAIISLAAKTRASREKIWKNGKIKPD